MTELHYHALKTELYKLLYYSNRCYIGPTTIAASRVFYIAGIIVITDGNVGIGDVGRYDNLLIQLLSQSCTCSVIEVPCGRNHKRGLGRVSHSEMLQFIATATFGAYFYESVDTVGFSNINGFMNVWSCLIMLLSCSVYWTGG